MMSYVFAHICFEFAEDRLIIVSDDKTNIVFPYSKIKEIHLTGKQGRLYFMYPSIIIHLKDESKYKIMGYGTNSRRAKRDEFSAFITDLHQHLGPYQNSINFKSGLFLPVWGILGMLCLGVVSIYNSTMDSPVFNPEKSLLFGLAVIVVSIMFMRSNGGTYDPENIPAKLI